MYYTVREVNFRETVGWGWGKRKPLPRQHSSSATWSRWGGYVYVVKGSTL